MDLQEYLLQDYEVQKDQFNSVKNIIKETIPLYAKSNEKSAWPYEIQGRKKDFDEKRFSSSTTAMIAYSMAMLNGKTHDLTADNQSDKYFDIIDECTGDKCKYLSAYKNAYKLLKEQWDANEGYFTSGTFGDNNPLTLTWVACFLRNYDIHKDNNEFFDKFVVRCKKYIKERFNNVYSDINELKYYETMLTKKNAHSTEEHRKNGLHNNHIFPLLKTAQLYHQIDSIIKTKNNLKKEVNSPIFSSFDEEHNCKKAVRNMFTNTLHYHNSLESVQDSEFDVAEMVFALEGRLLLEPNIENFDKNLLNRIFKVIDNRQKISIYWRPLKPISTSEKGLTLLPLSVEIAMSMLRICFLLGKKGETLFSNYYSLFDNYTRWLKSRLIPIHIEEDDKTYYGWCSEHVLHPEVIHPWETSQVLVYLANFNELLRRHIANTALKFADLSRSYYKNPKLGFKENNPPPNEFTDETDKKNGTVHIYEPSSSLNNYKDINDNYIENDDDKQYSLLLYGPPGTGKTTIAESIANSRDYPLITVTPSHFIASGPDQVETKAKNIFTVLEEQKDVVILFDEIDHLIMDREAKLYQGLGDMFQLMTPSMLVKINNLRKKKNNIFIIATNYIERIDPAIKRPGRIDKQYLILPFDKAARTKYFEEISESINKEEDGLKLLVKDTVLYSFSELQQVKKICVKLQKESSLSYKKLKDEPSMKQITPTISLASYASRFVLDEDKRKTTVTPFNEYLYLFYLKAEVEYEISDIEFKILENLIEIEYSEELSDHPKIYDILKHCRDNNKRFGKKTNELWKDLKKNKKR